MRLVYGFYGVVFAHFTFLVRETFFGYELPDLHVRWVSASLLLVMAVLLHWRERKKERETRNAQRRAQRRRKKERERAQE